MMNMAYSNDYVENDFKPGDILYTSWGYDQTNIDWYEVVKVTPKTVSVVQVRSTETETGFMSGYSLPIPGMQVGKPMRVQVRRYMGINGHLAKRWDGEERPYCSWYA